MSRGRAAAIFAAAIAALALGCGEPGPPPYGLGEAPVQRFRVEVEETIDVDGRPVEVQRFAELRLEVQSAEPGVTSIQLFVDSYYQRIAGAPGGPTELSISKRGVATSSEERQALLDPNSESPGWGRVRDLPERPVQAVDLDPSGNTIGEVWHTSHPVLQAVDLMDWLLLALGPLPARRQTAWSGSRAVPRIGQYQLGIELPVRGEWDPVDPLRIRLSGSARRDSLRVHADLEGAIQLDYSATLELAPSGRPEQARVELQMHFRATDGTRVSSRHRVDVQCLDCKRSFSAAATRSDTSGA